MPGGRPVLADWHADSGECWETNTRVTSDRSRARCRKALWPNCNRSRVGSVSAGRGIPGVRPAGAAWSGMALPGRWLAGWEIDIDNSSLKSRALRRPTASCGRSVSLVITSEGEGRKDPAWQCDLPGDDRAGSMPDLAFGIQTSLPEVWGGPVRFRREMLGGSLMHSIGFRIAKQQS